MIERMIHTTITTAIARHTSTDRARIHSDCVTACADCASTAATLSPSIVPSWEKPSPIFVEMSAFSTVMTRAAPRMSPLSTSLFTREVKVS